MIDYQKIAVILIRTLGLYFSLWAILNWAIIAVGTLVIVSGLSPRLYVNTEIRFIDSVLELAVGLILFARSKSLANSLVESVDDIIEIKNFSSDFNKVGKK